MADLEITGSFPALDISVCGMKLPIKRLRLELGPDNLPKLEITLDAISIAIELDEPIDMRFTVEGCYDKDCANKITNLIEKWIRSSKLGQ